MQGLAVIPGQTGPHLMQAAFVVEDVEKAARAWIAATGIGPFFLVPHIQLAEARYRGALVDGLDFSVALAQSGGVQIELIEQHCDTPSAYRDTVPKGRACARYCGQAHPGRCRGSCARARRVRLDRPQGVVVQFVHRSGFADHHRPPF